jgi:hypothetical protein
MFAYTRGDIAEVQTVAGRLHLVADMNFFAGLDRTSKPTVLRRMETADRKTARAFPEHLPEAAPDRIHTILTDNGIRCAEQPRNQNRNTA